MPVAQQGLRQVRTYEPCTTGYECFHYCLLSDHRGRPPIPLGSAMVSIAPPPGTRRSRVGWLPSRELRPVPRDRPRPLLGWNTPPRRKGGACGGAPTRLAPPQAVREAPREECQRPRRPAAEITEPHLPVGKEGSLPNCPPAQARQERTANPG